MNVLVIGGSRFVGYLLAWRLLARGDRVTLLNRGTMPDPFGDRVERLRGDRRTAEAASLLRGRRFDATVDLAAYQPSDLAPMFDAPGPDGLGHYVMISTGQVYLVRQGVPLPAREEDYDGPLIEEIAAGHPDRGEWEYGVGKRGCEDLVAERLPRATRLRIPMVNGERDYYRRIEGYLWRLLDGGPILVPDGGARPTRHVYGADVARAIADLLGDEKTFGRAYNLAQDETPTVVELLVWMAEALGASPRLVAVPRETLVRAGLDAVAVSPFSGRWMSFLDPSRARAELGFRHLPAREYVGRVVAAFLAHPPADRPRGYAERAREVALAGTLSSSA